MISFPNFVKKNFKHFTDQLPDNMLNNFKAFPSDDMVIFKINTFVPNITIDTVDYHFTIPIVAPPPIKIGEKEYEYKKWHLAAFNPDMEITILDNTYTDEYTSLCIKKEFLNKIASEITQKDNVCFSIAENPFSPQLLMAINNYISELTLYYGKSSLMLQSICVQIAVFILREAKSNISKDIVPPIIDGNFVETAKEYMRNYYNTDITLNEICNLVHVSPSHFMRTFKAKTGLSVHEYLLNIRLEKAKELLGKTRISVDEACTCCGFINLSHFSKTFKKHFGITPIEYQKYMLY